MKFLFQCTTVRLATKEYHIFGAHADTCGWVPQFGKASILDLIGEKFSDLKKEDEVTVFFWKLRERGTNKECGSCVRKETSGHDLHWG